MSDQSYEPGSGVPVGPRAGFWPRLGAVIVDAIVVIGVYLFCFLVLSESLAALILLVGSFVYYIYFEGSASGQTLGKRALGIRVIDRNTGGPIGYWRAFVRYIGRIISSLPLYLGYLWMLWDKDKQTWHDKFVNSIVVPTSAYPVS